MHRASPPDTRSVCRRLTGVPFSDSRAPRLQDSRRPHAAPHPPAPPPSPSSREEQATGFSLGAARNEVDVLSHVESEAVDRVGEDAVRKPRAPSKSNSVKDAESNIVLNIKVSGALSESEKTRALHVAAQRATDLQTRLDSLCERCARQIRAMEKTKSLLVAALKEGERIIKSRESGSRPPRSKSWP